MWPYISHNPSRLVVSHVAARTEDLRGMNRPERRLEEGEMLVTGPPGTDSRRSEYEAADSVTRQVWWGIQSSAALSMNVYASPAEVLSASISFHLLPVFRLNAAGSPYRLQHSMIVVLSGPLP